MPCKHRAHIGQRGSDCRYRIQQERVGIAQTDAEAATKAAFGAHTEAGREHGWMDGQLMASQEPSQVQSQRVASCRRLPVSEAAAGKRPGGYHVGVTHRHDRPYMATFARVVT